MTNQTHLLKLKVISILNKITTKVESWFFKLYRRVIAVSANNSATLLTFHRVYETAFFDGQDFVAKDEFYLKMKLIKQYFTVLSLPELLACCKENKIPPLAVTVTVDDGYYDSYSIITPILESLNIQGAFFIATAGIDSGLLWSDKIFNAIQRTEKKQIKNFLNFPCFTIITNDEKKIARQDIHNKCKYMTLENREKAINELVGLLDVDISEQQFLSAANLAQMHSSGMSIGAHTHQHPILALETPVSAFKEISHSKAILENIIDAPVEYFAYPNGKYGVDFDQSHVDMVKKLGFKAALTTNWGSLRSGDDLFNIPRYTPWDRDAFRFGIRLCHHFQKKTKDKN